MTPNSTQKHPGHSPGIHEKQPKHPERSRRVGGVVLSLLLLLLTSTSIRTQAQEREHFEHSFTELKAMLEGEQQASFERAVYLSEVPYWQNEYSYEEFRELIDLQLVFINALATAGDDRENEEFDVTVNRDGLFAIDKLLYTPEEKEQLYENTLHNWAIFKWLTDTVDMGWARHLPFAYASNDPFGREDWKHSQVMNLLTESNGNCYSLTALYKILADRLETEAELCTAPQHIFIRHRDKTGRAFNVELATAGFPTAGKLQTLTYTTSDAIRSGISLRGYDAKQSVGLCLVNLAKAYEHSFDTKTDDFLMRCAELSLKHDPQNLNALLLKQQVLNERVRLAMEAENTRTVASARRSSEVAPLLAELEDHLAHLHQLGYRPMPVDMQRIILDGLQSPEDLSYYTQNKNPSPWTTITPEDPDDAKYVTLTGGVFQEVFDPTEPITCGHFVYYPVKAQITDYVPDQHQYELIDPVAFAYNFGARMYDARIGRFMSVDPFTKAYPQSSPYQFAANSPIWAVDKDGNYVYVVTRETVVGPDGQLGEPVITVTKVESIEELKILGAKVLSQTPLGKEELESYISDEGNDLYLATDYFARNSSDYPGGITIYTDKNLGGLSEAAIDENQGTYTNKHLKSPADRGTEIFVGIKPRDEAQSSSFIVLNTKVAEDLMLTGKSEESDYIFARILIHEVHAHVTLMLQGVQPSEQHNEYGEEDHNSTPKEGSPAEKINEQINNVRTKAKDSQEKKE